MAIKDWSTTDADNDDADLSNNIDWRENQAPSTVNNSNRGMMTQIKRFWDDILGGTYFVPAANVAGTADAITLTTDQGVAAYAAGLRLSFLAEANNTGAVTVNVDGLGAKAINRLGSALVASDILNGDAVVILYDGTDFELVHPDRSGYLRTLYDANTVLAADTDNTPAAVTMAEQTMLGRVTSGNIAALTAAQANGILGGTLVAAIQDQKSQNTDGGTFTSGADRTRDLNTEVFDIFGVVSIASNQFTLGAGDWIIEWSAPGHRVRSHQSLLYDITGAAEIARGTPEYADDVTGSENEAINIQTRSIGIARVSPGSSNVYEIRHRCDFSISTSGFGFAANKGTEVYTTVKIYRG